MRSFIVAAALVGFAGQAQAEIFDGGFVGIHGGYENSSIDTGKILDAAGLPGTVNGKSSGNATIGIVLGYDFAATQDFVVGAELGASFSTGSNRQVAVLDDDPTVPIGLEYKSKALYEISARAGYVVSDSTMLYIRGGYANSKLTTVATIPGDPPERVKGNNNGWLIGAGVEYALSEQFKARVEYKHYELKGPVTRDQALVGVGYAF